MTEPKKPRRRKAQAKPVEPVETQVEKTEEEIQKFENNSAKDNF